MNELDSPILDLQPFLKHAGQIFPEGRLLFLVNNNNNNKIIIITTTTTTTTTTTIIIPYLPVYRPHFFQGKKRSKFGVRLIRGYKSFELINMQNFPTHTESTKLLKA